MHVIYIDGSEPMVRLVERSAAHQGVGCKGFCSAIAGRMAALSCYCDAVVADEHLPRFRGSQILAELRSTRPCVGRILVTSVRDFAVGLRAFQCGAHDMMAKPFDFKSFWNSVQAAAATAQHLDYLERLDRVIASRPDSPALRPSMTAFMPCELDGLPSALVDVLDDILDGLSSKESAARRGVEDGTIRGQRATIYERLGMDRQRILARRPLHLSSPLRRREDPGRNPDELNQRAEQVDGVTLRGGLGERVVGLEVVQHLIAESVEQLPVAARKPGDSAR